MRKILMIVLVVFVVLLALILGTSAYENHAKKTAVTKTSNTFVEDVLTNKATDSYNLFTTAEKKNVDLVSWSQQVQKLSSFFAGQTATFQGIDDSSTFVKTSYKIPGKDGAYTYILWLEQDNKDWHVQSFSSQLGG